MRKQKNLGSFEPKSLDFKFAPESFQAQQPLPPGTPFDHLQYTGNIEADTQMDLNEYQKENKDQLRKYSKLMENIWDSEFWFAVAFRDREAKEEFLNEFGLNELGDKYLDGGKLAKKLRLLRSGK